MTNSLRLIKVPFAEKDDAKVLGARWDAAIKNWYIPQGVDPKKLEKWWRFLDCPFEEKDEAREKLIYGNGIRSISHFLLK